MNTPCRCLINIILGSCACLCAVAEQPLPDLERSPRNWTLSFYFENDLFANTDENYTNGTKLTWISPDLSKFREAGKLPDWAYNLVQHLPFIDREGIQRNVAISLGQNIYTPSDIRKEALIPNDRPYAAWLYTGIAFHNKTESWLDTIEVNFGVVGPWAMGKEAQNLVHRIRNIATAKGWHNQIKNEPAVNFIWERKFRKTIFGESSGFGIDVLGHGGASFGNVYTYINMGGGLRAGWNLPEDFGAALIRLAGDTNAPASRSDLRYINEKTISFHWFASVDGRAIARDLTLDGNTWRNSHSVDKKNYVGDFSTGLATIIGSWKFSYAQTFRSRTFEGSPNHSFGSINISYSY